MDPETPEGDAAEQARLAEDVLDDEEPEPVEVPLDADPADLAEQHRAVPVDEEYD
ncbi:hypothetical protein [Saccharopolyspora phatthalungensis]|uniref:Uncharacterized protein n=1 Tax=Saccharopolyspora phatthalungensis TaxID=664693 RepID=A0A840QH55_9PSEU|nr:hypothetical protein [Saccharopolyspora phatthalungensis]MBB5157875.1 hypothetical protein [Saccharopolyspora phatthalungensis]